MPPDMLTPPQRVQKQVVLLWEHLYRRVTKRDKYRLDLRKNNQQALLDNFIKKLHKGPGLAAAGPHYLTRYFAYQFGYWSDKNTENSLSLAWIIGTKAWERWAHAQREAPGYFDKLSEEKMSAAGLPVADLGAIFEQSSFAVPAADVVKGFESEEVEKRLYYNTENGLFHCLATTTLYVACATCIGCIHRIECRLLLEKKYPLLHAKRFPEL
jgi:hypothetical protein